MRLSVVAVGRNDDYGGDFTGRCRCFVHQLCTQLGDHCGSFELVMVEWNSLPGRAPLRSQVVPRALPGNVTLRFIEVSNTLHRSFPNSDRIALFEYIAKNVGVRRSRGEFILATNPDILFSDSLIDFLTSDALDPTAYYRTDRYDFDGEVGPARSTAQNLSTARDTTRSKIFYGEEIRADFESGGPPYLHASGDFWLAHRSVWERLRGYREFASSSHIDSILCLEAHGLGIPQHVFPTSMAIFHQVHSADDRLSRPETDLGAWQTLCAEDDLRPDRRNWGLGREKLVESRFTMHSNPDLGLFRGPRLLSAQALEANRRRT